ncbi:hypothetical protein BVRB_021530, partial [Beta vulgaris subsp. vulgaris]
HSCGVYMLLAIKHNADRFVESVQLGNIVEERKWLLCEDVMCDFNEARESVKALMSSLGRVPTEVVYCVNVFL